jgi:hypothetical protein
MGGWCWQDIWRGRGPDWTGAFLLAMARNKGWSRDSPFQSLSGDSVVQCFRSCPSLQP